MGTFGIDANNVKEIVITTEKGMQSFRNPKVVFVDERLLRISEGMRTYFFNIDYIISFDITWKTIS